MTEDRKDAKKSASIGFLGALLLFASKGLFIDAMNQLSFRGPIPRSSGRSNEAIKNWPTTIGPGCFRATNTGLGWAVFNSPNQSAILGYVPKDKFGTASGMNTTTARTGGAMGVALPATLFTYGLAVAGLSPAEIESPQSWGRTPEVFVRSFSQTVPIVSLITCSIPFSAVRGSQRD